jgi:hypothetical protein
VAGSPAHPEKVVLSNMDCFIIPLTGSRWYVVTGNASLTVSPDLFNVAAASFGTIGVTTLLRIKLIKAKKYVVMTYHPISTITQAVLTMEEATKDTYNDYVHGILFSKDSGVICTGHLTSDLENNIKIQSFRGAMDPWFYLHTRT